MKNLPNEIYLNFGVDKDEVDLTNEDFDDLVGVTWFYTKLNDQDVKYVLPSPDISYDELISFAMYLCGHDRDDIEQMYRDWKT